MSGSTMEGRSWLTAKGYRALGHPVPDDVPDDEVVVLRDSGTPPLSDGRTVKRRGWWRRSR